MTDCSKDDFDRAWTRSLTTRGTYAQLKGDIDTLYRSVDLLTASPIDWARLEKLFYLNWLYDLFTLDEVEALLGQLPGSERLDDPLARDLRLTCEVWVAEWRSEFASVLKALAAIGDTHQNSRLWLHQIYVHGHSGDLESLEAEYALFSDAHIDDPLLQVRCDCVYIAFAAHLGRRDFDLDLFAIESRLLDLSPLLRFEANGFLGLFHRLVGESNESWRLEADGLRLAHWFGHPRTLSVALLASASSDVILGYLERAYDKLMDCRRLLDEVSHPYIHGSTYLEEARVLLALGHYQESVDSGKRASQMLGQLGYHDSAKVAKLITIGSLFLLGQEHEARARISVIIEDSFSHDMSGWHALVTRALFAWHQGDEEVTRRDLLALEESTARVGDQRWVLLAPFFFVHLLGDDRELPDEDSFPDTVRQHTRDWVPALKRLGGDLSARIDMKRLPTSIVGTLLARLISARERGESEREVLQVDTQQRSFACSDRRASLRRRPSLWMILVALARAAPEAVSVADLFAAGWPGEEQTSPVLASRRVYWVISELRRLGLYTMLVTMDPGYSLSSDTNVEFVE